MAFTAAIDALDQGRVVGIRPRGRSMEPRIRSGDLVMLYPIGHRLARPFEVGSVVLVKVKGSVYVHKITALDGDRVQIGNNKGHINGWTTRAKVYGVADV